MKMTVNSKILGGGIITLPKSKCTNPSSSADLKPLLGEKRAIPETSIMGKKMMQIFNKCGSDMTKANKEKMQKFLHE